ncbi:MAG: hypothetical protein IPO15_20780 [Anaerolineae bacterium]|uniref:hypothetical protein n=1 Tax=Candidatus Amarolinea dominans TaxID=3140696 RepID=UPI0031371952|nr:hypothetical protein [Anaerolineae bacterium]
MGGIDLWRSTNGGSLLTKTGQWWSAPSSAHADHHAIVESPGFNGGTNKIVFFGNDGGVYRADNVYTVLGTTGWQELNNNPGITQFPWRSRQPNERRDRGRYRITEPCVSTATRKPGARCMAVMAVSRLLIHLTRIASTVNMSMRGFIAAAMGVVRPKYISGIYWDGSQWTCLSAPYRIDDACNNTANFISPFILDPNNPNRLLVGGRSLWRSNDPKTANTVRRVLLGQHQSAD